MAGPAVVPESLLNQDAEDGATDLASKTVGNMVQITGRIKPEYLDTDTQIYLRINQAGVYEAFPVDVKLEDSTRMMEAFVCIFILHHWLRAKTTWRL